MRDFRFIMSEESLSWKALPEIFRPSNELRIYTFPLEAEVMEFSFKLSEPQ